METLRYGIVGAGFVSGFHLRALEAVRGVEIAGLTSRTPPHALAESVRARGLGTGQVFDSVREINQSLGTTVLVVEQNASMALGIASRGYVLEGGRVVLSGAAGELLENPEVREAYLGGKPARLFSNR